MQHILICTIFRNREKYIHRWHQQILSFVNHFNDIKFSISIYENDSIDNTKKTLEMLDLSKFQHNWRRYDNLQTQYYGSIVNKDRVKNLAEARNLCISQAADHMNDYSKILFIEPDFKYNLEDAIKILNAEKRYGIELDIISGISEMNGVFYDTWATRRTESETWGRVEIGDGIDRVWSTFNGFCLYNSKPFQNGIKFDWFNRRLQTFDCDTAVICENFRECGYDRIFIEKSAIFKHEV
jgi:hypothetical protein